MEEERRRQKLKEKRNNEPITMIMAPPTISDSSLARSILARP